MVDNVLLNVEEWAIYCCRLGVVVAEEDRYGVRVRLFLQTFVEHGKLSGSNLRSFALYLRVVGGLLDDNNDDEVMSIESLKLDLQRMILDEARAAAASQLQTRKGSRSGQPVSKDGLDYVAAFNLFDADGNGAINVDEFRRTLFRLKLVDHLPESQVPQLIQLFDRNKKGYITLEDFIRFVGVDDQKQARKTGKAYLKGDGDVDDDGDDGDSDSGDDPETHIYSLNTHKPPAAITRNADCDFLCWFLYKECCKCEPNDPESMVSELETVCTESDISHTHSRGNHSGYISVKELWNVLFELKLRGSLSKEQFEKGIKYLMEDGRDGDLTKADMQRVRGVKGNTGASAVIDTDHAEVNYEALCRYIVRMGRSYNTNVQEKKTRDVQVFEKLLTSLMKEFSDILAESVTAASGDEGYDVDQLFHVPPYGDIVCSLAIHESRWEARRTSSRHLG
jgi:Ca2+-binding EF-hand superfamily protein